MALLGQVRERERGREREGERERERESATGPSMAPLGYVELTKTLWHFQANQEFLF